MKNPPKNRPVKKETNFVKAQFQTDLPEDTANASKPFSVLAIVGFICALLVPLVGFIISIIALKKIDPEHEKGRELAIAGIIAATAIFLLTILSAIVDPSIYTR